MKQAVIIAGGKGTRLKTRLNGLPKPLVDICGKPLLERQIDLLCQYGFESILLLVNHKAEKIQQFLGSGRNWNIRIECINEGEPLGTAGAVIEAFPWLADNFLVVYGDTIFDIDLYRFEKFFCAKPKLIAALFLHPNDHPQDSDLVEVDDDCIIKKFYPYPHSKEIFLPNLVNAGLYWMRKDALTAFRGNRRFLDFGKDVFPSLIKMGNSLYGYVSPEYIKDCGTPSRLDLACSDFATGRIKSQNLNEVQSAIFIDRDGTINEDLGLISDPKNFHLFPEAPLAIRLLNQSNYKTIIVTNQPVVARGDCTEQKLKEIHNKMESLLGISGAYVDRIEFCPHHPDGGYLGERCDLKIKCTCRKPAIGMIQKVANDLNINIDLSWLIGDSTTDILTAKSAGLKSILVETGHAGLDDRYSVLPDFISPNIYQAVNFILFKYPKLLSLIKSLDLNICPGDLIFIGGQSRSGKSTLANGIKYFLRSRQIHAHVISLDGWLKKGGDRVGENVMGRYQIDVIQSFIEKVSLRINLDKLAIPIYSKIHGEARGFSFIEKGDAETVYIFEGTIALYFSQFISAHRKKSIYVEINETERMNRVVSEYNTRGRDLKEAINIYNSRLEDEVPIVADTKGFSDFNIELKIN
jgi:histidinol-phosphate phosphatase family protein